MIDTIYIERQVADHERVRELCERFPDALRVNCRTYNEVFNPKAQNFRLQKQKPSLILARKQGNLVLPAPPEYGIGEGRVFYFSHLLNCPYDCRYCFLQGMFRSAHYVLFVNYEEFVDGIRERIQQAQERCWFFSGYDCDSLALEPVTGFAQFMLEAFSGLPGGLLELRTKSTQIRSLLARPPLENVLVAFSLSPEELVGAVEHRTPSLAKRLSAIRRLQEAGWRVGLRFDPLLYYPGWESGYRRLFQEVFAVLDGDAIHSVSLGVFRLPAGYARTIGRLYPDAPLLAGPLDSDQGMVSYPARLRGAMLRYCQNLLLDHLDEARLHLCQDIPDVA